MDNLQINKDRARVDGLNSGTSGDSEDAAMLGVLIDQKCRSGFARQIFKRRAEPDLPG